MEIPLTIDIRQSLLVEYKQIKDKRKANNINIILLKDDGYTPNQISAILHLDEDTIYSQLQKFNSVGSITDFTKESYLGYFGKLDSFELAKLRNHVKTTLITDIKQLFSYIEQTFNVKYTADGLRKVLLRIGFSYKDLVLLSVKIDIEKQQSFVKDYQKLYTELTDNEAIIFIDGVHPQHNTHGSKAWLEKGIETFINCNSGRNRLNINGGYNPKNQDVIYIDDTTINAQSTIKLFDKIENKYPFLLTIYVISDNAKYYTCTLIEEYLKTSRIKLIHLPTYSPNLNLIERLWKFMRKKVINTSYYPKFKDFKENILSFFQNIDQHKEELKVFIGNDFKINYPKTTF